MGRVSRWVGFSHKSANVVRDLPYVCHGPLSYWDLLRGSQPYRQGLRWWAGSISLQGTSSPSSASGINLQCQILGGAKLEIFSVYSNRTLCTVESKTYQKKELLNENGNGGPVTSEGSCPSLTGPSCQRNPANTLLQAVWISVSLIKGITLPLPPTHTLFQNTFLSFSSLRKSSLTFKKL